MEHGSNKVGPHADEELARATRGHTQGGHSPRVEEWHEPEPAGEDQPGAAQVPADEAVPAPPPGMSGAEVAARSRLAASLRPSAFPADRARLLRIATEENAPDELLAALRGLPARGTYRDANDVWEALGHGSEDDAHRF